MLVEFAILLALIFLNGVLAMSELAVVSSRPARLRVIEKGGSRGAATALRLAENPGQFLSAVQIGITLVGILSGAFSGATIGLRFTRWLEAQGISNFAAEAVGVGGVVVAITYLSLIVGELVPKQIALRDPEGVAVRVAPAMALLSRVAHPLVWLLDASGRFVLRLLGHGAKAEATVTEEEVRTVIAEAESAGVLETEERRMITGVMRLADRTANAMMTSRRDVEILDLADGADALLAQLRRTKRQRLPVQQGGPDEIVGVVFVKDALDALTAEAPPADLRALVQKAPVVSDNADALDVLRAIRSSSVHMALVFDEYGHFEGVVTSGDLLEAIFGVFQEEGASEPAYVERGDGSYLVSGWMPVDELSELIATPVGKGGGYATVAGFVLHTLHRLPKVGEAFTVGNWRFEVVDLDGKRIDKLLVSRAA